MTRRRLPLWVHASDFLAFPRSANAAVVLQKRGPTTLLLEREVSKLDGRLRRQVIHDRPSLCWVRGGTVFHDDGFAPRPEAGADGLGARFFSTARAGGGDGPGTVRVLSDNSVVRSRKQVNQGELRGRGKNLVSLSTNVENPYG